MNSLLQPVSLQDRYRWEAEWPDGEIIRTGGNLVDAVRVSLIPAPSTGLSQHDLVGVEFVRRFIRQFKRATVGGFDHAAYFAQVEANQTEARKASRAVRDEKRADGVIEIKKMPPPKPVEAMKRDEVLQVICCKQFRYYVRHSDGAAIVTPADYELNL